MALATAAACSEAAERHGVDLAVLSGGVFQNRLLLERTSALLTAAGLRTLVPERLPPERRRHRLRAGRGGRGARLRLRAVASGVQDGLGRGERPVG